jgi:hypothetical protein
MMSLSQVVVAWTVVSKAEIPEVVMVFPPHFNKLVAPALSTSLSNGTSRQNQSIRYAEPEAIHKTPVLSQRRRRADRKRVR